MLTFRVKELELYVALAGEIMSIPEDKGGGASATSIT
jgi:hypothetical protein